MTCVNAGRRGGSEANPKGRQTIRACLLLRSKEIDEEGGTPKKERGKQAKGISPLFFLDFTIMAAVAWEERRGMGGKHGAFSACLPGERQGRGCAQTTELTALFF